MTWLKIKNCKLLESIDQEDIFLMSYMFDQSDSARILTGYSLWQSILVKISLPFSAIHRHCRACQFLCLVFMFALRKDVVSKFSTTIV
jgi:hypothetical protein